MLARYQAFEKLLWKPSEDASQTLSCHLPIHQGHQTPSTPLPSTHSRRKWFSEEEETSLLGKTKNKSMIIHKKQRWAQATKPTTTNKNYNNQLGRSPTVPTTVTCKNDKECQGQQQQRALHTHRYLCHRHQGNL